MEQSSIARLTLYGAIRCAGVGLLGGSLEGLLLSTQSTAPIGLVGYLVSSLVGALVVAAFAFVVGIVAGFLSHTLLRRFVISRGLALQFALVVLTVVGFFFWSFAADKWAEGSPAAAVFLATLPVMLFPVSFLLATPFFRRVEAGEKSKVGFLLVAAAGSLVVVGGGLAVLLGKYTGGNDALDSDPRFVIVAVDGLRGDLGGGETPNIDRLATGGVIFTDATTGAPSAGPGLASALTGLHPLRHRVLKNGMPLSRGIDSLPRLLKDEGYATAGFVSTDALSGARGFSNGFYVYDDDLGSPIPGLFQLRVSRLVLGSLGLIPTQRDGSVTTDHFLGWLDGHHHVPFLAVVHLVEPLPPIEPHGLAGYEANGAPGSPLIPHVGRLDKTDWSDDELRGIKRTYQEEVASVDLQVGRILDALDAHGLSDNTVVVLMGTGGLQLGGHGGAIDQTGLFEDTVNVPLVLRIPGKAADTDVPVSVRLHDLFVTLAVHAEIEPRGQHEGISLLGYMEGRFKKPLWTALVGVNGGGEPLIGARNNGIKYVRNVVTGEELLFDLADDPDEQHNLTDDTPKTLEDARRLVGPDAIRLGKLLDVTVKKVR